ncbi:flavin reductase family protein [Streptomyces sp. NPDC056500]|uniref:flavin reductase family protein n=1 Tax=Streptomyces sp. NPDC056500 TaxID=3345840 RepID=UPI00369FBFC2
MVTPSPRWNQPSGTSANHFQSAMRLWATGVAVVTTNGPDGPHGITVNSLLSVSLDPPTLLISLKRGSRTQRILVEHTDGFTVNVLAGEQRSLADRFTGCRDMGESQFAGLDHRTSAHGGGPELEDSLAALTCRTTERIDVADHTLIIASVTGIRLPTETRPHSPLIYTGRRYHTLPGSRSQPDGKAPAPARP